MGQRLGQHFLHDEQVLERIAACIDEEKTLRGTTACIEIGPGRGALTKYLLPLFPSLILIERDEMMRGVLQKLIKHHPSTQVIWDDVLQVPLTDHGDTLLVHDISVPLQSTVIVGNLPYYITSPIFRKFFVENRQLSGGVFLIQREVGEKIATNAHKKSYLRRLLNYQYGVTYAFTVPPTAFRPPPKVDSCVVVLRRKESPALPEMVSRERFERFLDALHGYKRKTLRKIASLERAAFDELGVSVPPSLEMKRVEELGRDEVKILLGVE